MLFKASPILQLLYLMTYTVAVGCFMMPFVVYRLKRDTVKSLRISGTFLQILSLMGIVPSLQVLLAGMTFFSDLKPGFFQFIQILFNTLILIGMWGLSFYWYRLTKSFNKKVFFLDQFKMLPAAVSAGILLLTIVSQGLLFFIDSDAAFSWSSIILAVFFFELAVTVFLGLLRLLRPDKDRINGFAALLIMPIVVLFGGLLYALIPNIDILIPAAGLIMLLSLASAVFFQLSQEVSPPGEFLSSILEKAGLTPREQEIALLLRDGLSYKEISDQLFVSLSTIQSHVGKVYAKLGVNSKTELSRKLSPK